MAYLGHITPETHLRLDPSDQWVEDWLRGVDRSLRLRKSAEGLKSAQGYHVLERRITHGEPNKLPLVRRDMSDRQVAARDGYIHISDVHPIYLQQPERILERLREAGGDLWSHRTGSKSGAENRADQLDYEEKVVEPRDRHEKRLKDYEAWARENYDVQDRLGNTVHSERTRLNNAGIVLTDADSHERDSRQEADHVHETASPSGRQSDELHHPDPAG